MVDTTPRLHYRQPRHGPYRPSCRVVAEHGHVVTVSHRHIMAVRRANPMNLLMGSWWVSGLDSTTAEVSITRISGHYCASSVVDKSAPSRTEYTWQSDQQ